MSSRGSVIYFVIANLALVDPMYQYSLRFYKDLFTLRLKKSKPNTDAIVATRPRQPFAPGLSPPNPNVVVSVQARRATTWASASSCCWTT